MTTPVPTGPPVTVLDPAGIAAGSVAAAAAELIGPLAGAATPRRLPWASGSSTAEISVDSVTRYALVLVTLLGDLGAETLAVAPGVIIETGQSTAPEVTFAPYSAAGSAKVAVVLPADDAGATPPFVVEITASRTDPDGTVRELDGAEVRAAFQVDLVEGVLGRLLAVLLDEKSRIRRQARELRAMRALAAAARNALDRIGADMSCPRFSDELIWDPDRRSPGTRPLEPLGTREDDAGYRARLRVLRGLRLPTPPWIDAAVNGPGGPDDAGAGWMADVGLSRRVTVDESPNPLLLATRLVAPGGSGDIPALLDAIRRVHLIWPAGSATGNSVHGLRQVPADVVERTATLRAALAGWHLPDGQPVAPSLAVALSLLAGRCDRLGHRPWAAVLGGQRDDGGSRLELGFGAVLSQPDPAQLDLAVDAAQALGDPGLVPRQRADDPAGAWLLSACGLRTVEQGADGTVFVSTAPMGPLVLDVTPGPAEPAPLALAARLSTPVSGDFDTPMAAVIAALADVPLAPVAAPAQLLAAAQPTGSAPALAALVGREDLPLVARVDEFAAQLGRVSTRDYAVFDLGAGLTAAAVAGPAVLAGILSRAATAGASSVVPLVTGAGTLALVLAVTGLPLAGSNLAARNTVFYSWEARALGPEPVDLAPRRGPAVTIRAAGAGISLVSCLVHVRTGNNDPYEWSPALPPDSLLTLRQYEHLLNIVELLTPVGVRVNTWEIRQHHVDVDGSGTATALTAGAARTYRHYRLAH